MTIYIGSIDYLYFLRSLTTEDSIFGKKRQLHKAATQERDLATSRQILLFENYNWYFDFRSFLSSKICCIRLNCNCNVDVLVVVGLI